MNTKKPPLESAVVKKTLEKLRLRGGFWFKIHGTPFQLAGIPDIIGCYHGRFIAFEAKRDSKGRPTPLQAFQIKKIRAAGGIATLIFTPEMALAILDRLDALREARQH
jgi:penicillin-binding protein-related factor A (putative recombinase)